MDKSNPSTCGLIHHTMREDISRHTKTTIACLTIAFLSILLPTPLFAQSFQLDDTVTEYPHHGTIYANMFEGCESLANAPALPATELAEACYKYGVKFGLYYSQELDWNEPDGGKYEEISETEYNTENVFWHGSPEQFYRLYDVAANYLKEKFSIYSIWL